MDNRTENEIRSAEAAFEFSRGYFGPMSERTRIVALAYARAKALAYAGEVLACWRMRTVACRLAYSGAAFDAVQREALGALGY